MKNCIKSLFCLVFLVCLGFAFPVVTRADHFAGTELTFVYTGTPGVYLLRFQFYRDCGGIEAPGSVTVRLNANACAGTNTINIPLQKTSFEEVSEVCNGQATECSPSPDNSVPGVELHEYSGLVFLPPTPNGCPDWTFSFSGCCRNDGIVNLNNGSSASLSFYTDAMLNNQNGIENSSPVFSSSPIPYVCLNDTVNYNPQVTDPDGDSLVYSLVSARGGATGTIPYTTNYSFNEPFGNATVTPFPAVLNAQTGQLTFQPTLLGGFVVVIRVEEWRRINGVPVLVGMVHRDVQVQVMECFTPPPTINLLTLITDGVAGTPYAYTEVKVLEACIPYCIEIPATTNAPSPIALTIASNAQNEIPGSVFTVVGQNSANPKGVLCFTPGPELASQTIQFTVSVVDDACPIPNDLIRAVQLTVKKSTGFRTIASTDSICGGESVQLSTQALAGVLPLTSAEYQSFSWTATDLAGMPVNGHFQNNNTTTLNPMVSPIQTTRYVLSSPTTFGCTDTASVVVHVKGIQPAIQSVTLPAVLCENVPTAVQTLVLGPTNAPGTAWTYSWSPAAGLSDTSVQNPVVSFTGISQMNYQLVVSNGGCSDTAALSVQFAPGIEVATGVLPAALCMGDSVLLYAAVTGAGANGSSYNWIGGDRIISETSQTTGAFPAQVGANYYVVEVTTNQGCVVTDSVLVTVTGVQPLIAQINSATPILCEGQQTNLSALITFDSLAVSPIFTYAWSPANGLSATNIPEPTVTASGSGTQVYTLEVSNGNCSSTDSISLQFVQQISASAAASPAIVCALDSVSLSATILPGGIAGVNYHWSGSGLLSATTANPTAVPGSVQTHYYVLEASIGGNCLSRDSVAVVVEGVRAQISGIGASPAAICPGQTTLLSVSANSAVAGFPQNGFSYQWSPVAGLQNATESATMAQPAASMHYQVTVSDNGKCQVPDSVQVLVGEIVEPAMLISFLNDSLAPPPQQILLQNASVSPGGIDSLTWTLINTGNPTEPAVYLAGDNQEYILTQPGTYQITLTVFAPYGCPYTAVRKVVVTGYKVPNIITPNGDGLNDSFVLPALKNGASVQVFNRWGKRVTEFGAGGEWAPGSEVPAGIYFYNVEDGDASYKGWLEVVR